MRTPDARPAHRGFTLIELLTVIAIIGILAAILIPTTSAVRVSAKRAKTKVLFSQLATACELFRQEYGFYPDITDGNHVLAPDKFFAALTGRDYRGNPLSGAALNGNTRRMGFYSLSDADQLKDQSGQVADGLTDAFGNTGIVILFDKDGDGLIKGGELASEVVRPGNSTMGLGAAITPGSDAFPAGGIRASVLLYTAGRGENPGDIIYSWR